ncbi:MAG: hypothetical protein IPG23_28685 [Burkholderiales bacterium]|nr:hypothetical protein [Burkholderiales bacterium]
MARTVLWRRWTTPLRHQRRQPFAIVDTVMALCWGMSIAALANVLLGDPVPALGRWPMPPGETGVASLLHEAPAAR